MKLNGHSPIIASTGMIFIFVLLTVCASGQPAGAGGSFYRVRLEDAEAVYFTPDHFKIRADGKTDVSEALQQAVDQVKVLHNFGILFIPQGSYLITKTIFVPPAIRLIGYGKQRPEIILGKNSPGFQAADLSDKGKAKYMFWFTGGVSKPGEAVHDAGASTFYSALSNINLVIGEGNPCAVALRTHYAQHSFISHADIHAGNGKAGMFDVGNEMEDVRFYGGDYGIYTTKPSPGWQFMMIDTYFEGQRKSAIKTQEAGLTIVRMNVKNAPSAIDIDSNFHERLFMENCRFESVSGPAITVSMENNASSQVSLRNIFCANVPVLVSYRQSGKSVPGEGKLYLVKNFMHGLQMDSLTADPGIKTICEIETVASAPAPAIKDIPEFPEISGWVNLKSLGAKGDGVTDDTRIIKEAIEKYPAIYVPQGWYVVSETITLKQHTALIGLSPIGTQLVLAENTPAFGGFGGPKALLETSAGGDNIVTGIGLSTGADNPRAVGCKWMAGEHSYLDDVKFVGGHGGMTRIGALPGPERKPRLSPTGGDASWDTQYWSLWITHGGGGTFKNIWTASTFATAGTYISNTSTPGRIYAMSVEHHVRTEVRFNNVAHYKVYALQLEEESREGTDCQPIELQDCHDIVFANLYMFRVIRLAKPYPYSIRNWGSSRVEFLNVHNYSQIKYTTSVPLYDMHTQSSVRPWEFNRLLLEDRPAGFEVKDKQTPELLAGGFEFAEGICKDRKNNIYFCESRMKRIYKWSAEKHSLTLIGDYPWEPLSLSCDKQDRLLVVFKYTPKPGYLRNGSPEVFVNPPDAAGTSFSGWGNSGFATWVYTLDPADADESIRLLDKIKMGTTDKIYKALYPAHRWRDYHDFNTVTVARADSCFVALDGQTIIPAVYDLARSTCLSEAFPGKPVYITNEYEKRTVKGEVSKDGYVSALNLFAEKGEFGLTTDDQGNVYIADGQIYVYDASGKPVGMIPVPERPTSVCAGTGDDHSLYITTAMSFYKIPRDQFSIK